MEGRAEPRPVASAALLAGEILAALDSLSETRVRGLDFSASTRTEPLRYLTDRQHQSSSTFSCELALDLSGFLQEDPIELEGGSINFYLYVLNSPIANTDPRGLVIYRCHRPLETAGGLYRSDARFNFRSPVCPSHDFLYDSDTGETRGYFPPGLIGPERGSHNWDCQPYVPTSRGRCVWMKFSRQPTGGYGIVGNNCHDFINRAEKACDCDYPAQYTPGYLN